MKYILYLVCTIILVLVFWLASLNLGVKTIPVECLPGALDCGNATRYSPLFWLPIWLVRFSAPDPYYIPWPGLVRQEALSVFISSVIYWFLIASGIIFLLHKVISRKTTS